MILEEAPEVRLEFEKENEADTTSIAESLLIGSCSCSRYIR